MNRIAGDVTERDIEISQLTFTYSRSLIEAQGKGVKHQNDVSDAIFHTMFQYFMQ